MGLLKRMVLFSKQNFRTIYVLFFCFIFDACTPQVSLNKTLSSDSNKNLNPTPTPTPTIYPGTLQEISFPTSGGSDFAANPVVYNNDVYFTSLTPTGAKIFRYKNSVVTQISNTNPGGDDNPNLLNVIGPHLYFNAFNGVGYKLFKYDGVSVTQISNVNPTDSDYVQEIFIFQNKIYFTAYFNSADNQQLLKVYVYDGSSSSIAFHTSSETQSDSAFNFVVLGSKVFFVSYNQNGFQKLFQYDGSIVSVVQDLRIGDHDNISYLTVGGDKLYFNATNANGFSK